MGAPIADHLQPGLSNPQMDALTRPIGITLTNEARVWWGWRNGVPASVGAAGNWVARMVNGAFDHLPLEEAVLNHARQRALGEEFGRDIDPPPEFHDRPADYWWEPAWLPLLKTQHGALIACDCTAPEVWGTPILYVDWGAFGDAVRRRRARSIGEMVTWWIEAFDQGAVRYVAAEGRWEHHWERLGPEQQRSQLV